MYPKLYPIPACLSPAFCSLLLFPILFSMPCLKSSLSSFMSFVCSGPLTTLKIHLPWSSQHLSFLVLLFHPAVGPLCSDQSWAVETSSISMFENSQTHSRLETQLSFPTSTPPHLRPAAPFFPFSPAHYIRSSFQVRTPRVKHPSSLPPSF